VAAVSPRSEASPAAQPSRVLARAAGWASTELLLIAFFVAMAFLGLFDVSGGLAADSWLTLLGGREILAHGLPHHDSLAILSHGRSWIDQQWLAQLFYYGLYKLGGFGLLLRTNVLLYLAPLVLCFVAARRRGASPICVLLGSLGLIFTGSFVRAQVLAELPFVLLVLLLVAESRRQSRRVFLAFPLLVLWANLHGSVVVGALLTAALGAVELVRWWKTRRPAGLARPLALLVVPWLCVLTSPYSLGLVGYYHGTLDNSMLAKYITEWKSPTFLSVWGVPFFTFIFVAVFLCARLPRRLNGFELLALALTAGGGLLAVRSILWFYYTAAILLPALLQEVVRARDTSRLPERDRLFRGGVAAVALGLVLVLLVRPMSSLATRWPGGATSTVSRVLRQDPQAKVLGNEMYADWLLFTVPDTRGRIAFDGRWEILSQAQMAQAMQFLFQIGADWESGGRGYRLLVLDPTRDANLVTIFHGRRHWRVLFRNERVIVLDRGRAR
jgi:hypothetical protein